MHKPMMDFLSDLENRTIPKAIAYGARLYADRPFLMAEGEQRFTYTDVDRESAILGHALAEAGVRQRQHVAVAMSNTVEHVLCVLAVWRLGAVLVPVPVDMPAEMLSQRLRSVDTDVLVVLGQGAKPALDHVRTIAVDYNGTWSVDGRLAASAFEEAPPADAEPGTTWNSLAGITFTSGTTGGSKGVMYSQNYALGEGGLDRPPGSQLSKDDVYLACLPLHHGIVFHTILSPWLSGGALAIIPRFSASRFWSQIRHFGVTVTMLVGPMLDYLANQPQTDVDADNTLRVIKGNPMRAEYYELYAERFGVALLESYAMSEASPITMSSPKDFRPGSCGKPVEDLFEVELVDEHDQVIDKPDVHGEFVVRPRRPHMMMEGYYKNPEATLRAFRNLWFHTGDVGYCDSDGYYFFVGRGNDSVRIKGAMVSPREIEETARGALPDVQDVVACVSHDNGEPYIKLCLEIGPGSTIDHGGLMDTLRASMTREMLPQYISIYDAFPRSVLGRADRGKLAKDGQLDLDLRRARPTTD